VPSPMFVAAIVGVEKLFRIDLDPTQAPVSFVRQALDRLSEGVSVRKNCWVCDHFTNSRQIFGHVRKSAHE
jgi:hypothetical protein